MQCIFFYFLKGVAHYESYFNGTVKFYCKSTTFVMYWQFYFVVTLAILFNALSRIAQVQLLWFWQQREGRILVRQNVAHCLKQISANWAGEKSVIQLSVPNTTQSLMLSSPALISFVKQRVGLYNAFSAKFLYISWEVWVRVYTTLPQVYYRLFDC